MDAIAKVDLENRTGRTALQVSPGPAPTLYDPLGRPIYNVGEYVQRQNDQTWSGRTPGPGVPIMPWLPHGDEPRQWMPAQGYNLNYVPRSEFRSIAPFQILRTLADTSDIVRVAIEDVKNQLVGMDWDVHPTEASGTDAKGAAGRIARVKDFFAYPDGEHPFVQWLQMFLEEVLVIDAASIYRQRTITGEPYALILVDGSTIKPVVDYTGRAPEAPETAYQQIGYGRIETEFHRPYRDPSDLKRALAAGMSDDTMRPVELVYAPKAPRTWTPYGQSPVERVIITVNLALRRQLHYLAFYTDGNIPDAFWKCPANWEPHQVKSMQDAFEKLLDGESGRRRRLRFMPGGEGAGLESARGDDEWKKEFDEYLARVVCFAFSISPLPLVQLMNRATGEMADAEESHSGHHPLGKFVAQVLTREIQEFLGERDLEFIWTQDKERDERLFLEQADKYIARGVWSRNEVRAEQGKEEIPGGDVITVDTPNGPVPLEDLVTLPGGGATPPAAGGKNPLDVPLPPAAGGGSAMGGNDSKVPASGVAPSQSEAARALDVPPPPAAGKLRLRMMADDLRRWRKLVLKGKTSRKFTSETIPRPLAQAIEESLRFSGTREDVDWAFRYLPKVRRPVVAVRRRIRLERKMRKACNAHFADVKGDVAKLVAQSYAEPESAKLRKAEDPTDDEIDAEMDWDAFLESVRPTLAESYLEGETLAEDVSGEESAFGLTDEQAVDYADQRGAELVGKRVLEDGSVIENPNPKWSIPQSVRDKLRQTVKTALDEKWTQAELQETIESPTFWTWRSDMIARTEVAIALNKGTAQVYTDAGVETVTLVDGPGCLMDGHDDSVPGVNGDVVTIEEFDAYPTGHPNCRRDAIPNLESQDNG